MIPSVCNYHITSHVLSMASGEEEPQVAYPISFTWSSNSCKHGDRKITSTQSITIKLIG